MKTIQLRRSVSVLAGSLGYALECEITSSQNITNKVFVKSRLVQKSKAFKDVFYAVASPQQLEQLPEDAPTANSPLFRDSKMVLYFDTMGLLEASFTHITKEVQRLTDEMELLGYQVYGEENPQPLDSDLTAIASLTTASFGRGLLTLGSASAVRSYIEAGTSSFDGVFASLTGIPTTIAGYGITDFNSLGDARWALLGHTHTADHVVSGVFNPGRLGSGTADNTKFLRGDSTWQVIDLSGYLPLTGGTMTGGIGFNVGNFVKLLDMSPAGGPDAYIRYDGSRAISFSDCFSTHGADVGKKIRIASNCEFGFSSGTTPSQDANDVIIARDAGDVLALRRSTNAQTFRVYGTYTDASNYVRASVAATSTSVTLAAETAGTGADNIDINITPAGAGQTVVTGLYAHRDFSTAYSNGKMIQATGVEGRTVTFGTVSGQPAIAFGTDLTTNFASNGYIYGHSGCLQFVGGGNNIRFWNAIEIGYPATFHVATSGGVITRNYLAICDSAAAATDGADVVLRRDAANILALRNASNGQKFRVYGDYTGASQYAALEFSVTQTGGDYFSHYIGPVNAGGSDYWSDNRGTIGGWAFLTIDVRSHPSSDAGTLEFQVGNAAIRDTTLGGYLAFFDGRSYTSTGQYGHRNYFNNPNTASHTLGLFQVSGHTKSALTVYTNSVLKAEITSAGAFNSYGAWTDDSNYVRASLAATSTSVTLAAETAGTGADNLNLVLSAAGTGYVSITQSNNDGLALKLTGINNGGGNSANTIFGIDGYATSPTTLTNYVFTVAASGQVGIDTSWFNANQFVKNSLTINGVYGFRVAADLSTFGIHSDYGGNNLQQILIYRQSGNMALMSGGGILGIGGLTSSYPALKRSGTELQVRLADDSGYAHLRAANLITQGEIQTDNNYLVFRLANAAAFILYGGDALLYYRALSFGSTAGNYADCSILREGSGVLALRNDHSGAALVSQTFRVYGARTDDSNYVRASLAATSTSVTLAAQTAGTGADDVDIYLTPAGTGKLRVGTGSFGLVFHANDFSAAFPFSPIDGGYALGIGLAYSPAVAIRDGADYGIIATNIRAVQGGSIGWGAAVTTASMTDSVDVAFRRASAGLVEICNGTAGQYRDLKLRTAYLTSGLDFSSGFCTITAYGGGLSISRGVFLPSLTFDANSELSSTGGALTFRHYSNPASLQLYGTYTDASNYVRASVAATSTSVTLAAETAGTGADNIDINITPAGNGGIVLNTEYRVALNGSSLNTHFAIVAPGVNVRFTQDAVGSYTQRGFAIAADGAWRFTVGDNTSNKKIGIQSDYLLGWVSGNVTATNPTLDTAIARNAAGVVEVNNGTAGTYRAIKASQFSIGDTGTGIGHNGSFIVISGTVYCESSFQSNSGGFKLGAGGGSGPLVALGIKDTGVAQIYDGNTLHNYRDLHLRTLQGFYAYTDGSNYQGYKLTSGASSVTLSAETAGTGADNIDINITPAGTGNVSIGVSGAALRTVTASTQLYLLNDLFQLDNGDGARIFGIQTLQNNSAPIHIRSAGGDGLQVLNTGGVTIDNSVSPDSAATLKLNARGTQLAPLLNAGGFTVNGTGTFVTFGHLSSASYPALKRSSTELQVRLADDSDYAPLKAYEGMFIGRAYGGGLSVAAGATTPIPSSLFSIYNETVANIEGGNWGRLKIGYPFGGSACVISTDSAGSGSTPYILIQSGGNTLIDGVNYKFAVGGGTSGNQNLMFLGADSNTDADTTCYIGTQRVSSTAKPHLWINAQSLKFSVGAVAGANYASANPMRLTSAGVLELYGTSAGWTDASNYVRASLAATSTSVTLTAETAGTGAGNIDINITPAGSGRLLTGRSLTIGNVTLDQANGTGDISLVSPYLANFIFESQQASQSSALFAKTADGKISGIIHYSSGHANGSLSAYYTATGVPMAFFVATAEVMRITTGGLVGIGTASPTAYLDLPASTTSAASLRIRTGTAPTSPNSGDLWHDSTQKTLSYYVAGVTQTVEGVLFSQTNSVTVANTVTETALTSTGVGTLTLPANFLVAGKTIKIRAVGYHSSTASPTITIRVKLGSTTILTTGAITSGNGTDDAWVCDALFTCRTTGGTGTVIGQGYYEEVHGAGSRGGMVNTATTTIDTTASQAITITAEWGTADAGNTISCTNVLVEILN